MMEPVHRFCSSAHERAKLKVSGPFLSASPRSQARELIFAYDGAFARRLQRVHLP